MRSISSRPRTDTDERVLVWAPPRDARLTCGFLEEQGFEARDCRSWEGLKAELQVGAGTIVAAGEFLSGDTLAKLEDLMLAQPAWSDLPVIIIGGSEPSAETGRFDLLGNVALLHRPLSVDTLASTIRSALRARRRQYQIRDLLLQRDEADRRKDEFLAMLAHELRNPLAPLRTGLHVLRLKPTEEVAERTRGMMERQITNLIRLVDDLLDVSRLTRRAIVLKKRPVDVRETARQATDAIGRLAAERGLTVELALCRSSTYVQADPVRLEQMVGNLLANALKFTPQGGRIRVEVAEEPGWVVIRVRDNGLGIPAGQLPHVFELFAQTDRPLDRSQGGLGIGLTVVRSLAELHGGAAEIFSEGEGRGTEAVIRLPVLSEEDYALQNDEREAARRARGGQRILIIEDNSDVAEALGMYLEHIGHDVTITRDGCAGLETALRQRPTVVICDIGLPGMNGYDIARRLRAEPGFERCRLIAITGYGDVVDRERARQAGFAHHLTKPADPALVAQLVSGEVPEEEPR